MNETELKKYRDDIDGIDRKIIELLNQRCLAVKNIGELKNAANAPVFVPERERAVFERLDAANTQGLLTPAALRAVYREIMAAARELERPLRVAFLGPEGTFTHEAACAKFSHQTAFMPERTIYDVFAAVECNRADYGCVPVENSTEGVVTSTLDRLFNSTLKICNEIFLPVHHHLAGYGPIAAIKKIYSHRQALGQCHNFLQEHCHRAELLETASTAQAAQMALESGSECACLCGGAAVELTGIPVLMANVEDSASNTTRFLVLGKQETNPTGNDKTSLCLGMPDRAGALYQALEPFKNAKISMTMIESRPGKVSAFEYCFFVDIIGHRLDKPVQEALRAASGICSFVKVLGSYPRGND